MMEMKWMQEDRRRGRDEERVRCLTSTVEMLPMTFCLLSVTAREETPSELRSSRAEVRGLSPLEGSAGQLKLHAVAPGGPPEGQSGREL
jgi:hypothetical protein